MSGHSHWARIKRKKGAADAKRATAWSKLIRAVTVAARDGGGLKLEYAIEKAKQANCTKDTIERAIKKGTGELEGEHLESMVLEGYGPGGVAIIVEGLTDNRIRILAEMRNIFEKGGGSLAGTNAVAFQFERKALFTIAAEGVTEDAVLEAGLDAGADNVALAIDVFEVTSAVKDFAAVSRALGAKFKLASADLVFLPTSRVPVTHADKARRLMGLLGSIDEHADVQNVYSNYELPDDVAAALEASE